MTIRPDFSQYVAHFTKSATVPGQPPRSALSVLANILRDKQILRTRMPWFGAQCAAFTECTWTSLLAHAQRYSSYGIGFEKTLLWNQGGGPAIYLRPDCYDAQAAYLKKWSNADPRPFAGKVADFLTPISYEPFQVRGGDTVGAIDFSHEREWRVPAGLTFEYSDVAFVTVKNPEDVSQLPSAAVAAIGSDRFLSMSNYQRIEQLWPTLHVERDSSPF